MDDLIIPQRTKTFLSKQNDNNACVQTLNVVIRNTAKLVLDECDAEEIKKIEKIKLETVILKGEYLDTMKIIYEKLVKNMKKSLIDGRPMSCDINGKYDILPPHGVYNQAGVMCCQNLPVPCQICAVHGITIKEWSISNPEKMAIIKEFINEMTIKGWEPKMHIGPEIIPGIKKLYVTCDFD